MKPFAKDRLDGIFGSVDETHRLITKFNLSNGLIDDMGMMLNDLPNKYKHGKAVKDNIEEKIQSNKGKINLTQIRKIITNNYTLYSDLKNNRTDKDKIKREFKNIYSDVKNTIVEILHENAKVTLIEPADNDERLFKKNKLKNADEVNGFMTKLGGSILSSNYYEKKINIHKMANFESKKSVNFDYVESYYNAFIGKFSEKIQGKNALAKESIEGTLMDISGAEIKKEVHSGNSYFHSATPEKKQVEPNNKVELDIARKMATSFITQLMDSMAIVEILSHAYNNSKVK